jgi:hypothetical protein
MKRTDLSLQIKDFIFLAEKRIGNSIKARNLETSTTLATLAGTPEVALPADYHTMKTIKIGGNPDKELILINDTARFDYAKLGRGKPDNYTVSGSNLILTPTPDAVYQLSIQYYQDLPLLSSVNPTNWLLEDYPYIYLYGALIEGSTYVEEPEQVDFFLQKYNSAIEDIWRNFGNSSMSGSPLQAYSSYVV